MVGGKWGTGTSSLQGRAVGVVPGGRWGAHAPRARACPAACPYHQPPPPTPNRQPPTTGRYGCVKRLANKPLSEFAGSDSWLRLHHAERDGLIRVEVGVP
jgi:hypothetical protein